MGFLQRLFRPPSATTGLVSDGTFAGNTAGAPTTRGASNVNESNVNEIAGDRSGFHRLSDQQLQAHMGIRRYGAFELTEAIRPAYHLEVEPRQGFRRDRYVDEADGSSTPVVMAAVTASHLMDVFLDLIDTLGPVVDVVLESSHHGGDADDLHRSHIDLPVLKSILLEFEDVLLDDGCAGIAVVNPKRRQEIQLDEHKLLFAYGRPLEAVERRLIAGDVYPDPSIRFITEAEHIHSSTRRLYDRFGQFKLRLGIDDGLFG